LTLPPTDISFLIYEISSKLFGYLKNFTELFDEVVHSNDFGDYCFATTKLLKINDMYNFFIMFF